MKLENSLLIKNKLFAKKCEKDSEHRRRVEAPEMHCYFGAISMFGAKKPKNMADRQSNPSSSSSSDSHGSLVNELCRLVDTIRQSNNDGHRRENENHATETTRAAITRLSLSVNGRRNTTNDKNPITPQFVPSRANVPKQTKRKKLILKRVKLRLLLL
jgi:hypothetical protein